MSRRSRAMMLATVGALAAAGFSVLVAAGPGGSPRAKPPEKTPPRPMLVYVGADDCVPCRAWQRDHAPSLQSPAFARLDYREVKSPSVLHLLKDEYWPEDLRGLRSRLAPGDGVPLWLVVVDDAIVDRAHGARQWDETILPKLRVLLR